MLYWRHDNKPKGAKMAKKVKRYRSTVACAALDLAGETSVMGHENNEGETLIDVCVWKRGKLSKADVSFNAMIGESALKKLGFSNAYQDGEEEILALADMRVAYDINKKPYTITYANEAQIKSLRAIINYTCVKPSICRNDGEVSPAEFKSALTRYLRQRQK